MTAKKRIYVADFETCSTEPIKYDKDFNILNKEIEAKIWLSCLYDIESEETILNHNIQDFINTIKNKNSTIYFHNLKFDGSFIIPYLLNNGFKQLSDKDNKEKNYKKNTFHLLIDELNNWYTLTIYWDFKLEKLPRTTRKKKSWQKTTIIDSLKILPMTVKEMGEKFLKLPPEQQKGTIDYELVRPDGYIPTQEEIDYIIKDCKIVAMGVKHLLDNGLTKNTLSGNAFKSWMNIRFKGNRMFYRVYMPELTREEDLFVRASYMGGWTYCNPKFKNTDCELKGLTLDVNSLYPYVMKNCPLPFGKPVEFKGKYKPNKQNPLYIQKVKLIGFTLKPNKLPIISNRNNMFSNDGSYLESGKEIILTLTNVDLELILESYNCADVKYLGGYMFGANTDYFKEYVDYYGKKKITAENNVERQIAKLMLNSLYGKFGSKPVRTPKQIMLDERGIIKTRLDAKNEYIATSYYLPVATFITAYARSITIRAAIDNIDNFMYADTDSLHLNITPDKLDQIDLNIDTDFTGALGLWKVENVFTDAKFLGSKRYIEYGFDYKEYIQTGKMDMEWNVKCAGLPKELHSEIKSKEDFIINKEFLGKNVSRIVKNGTVIVKSKFTLNELD